MVSPVAVQPPDLAQILARIADVQATFGDDECSVEEWRRRYQEGINGWRTQDKTAVFVNFVSNLLQRAMPGETYNRCYAAMDKAFRALGEVTPDSAAAALSAARYRFPPQGVAVVVAAKRIVEDSGFAWPQYVRLAEKRYEQDFPEDPFLSIKGVGYKTRDLALSDMSDRFIAMDLHVVRVVVRTGLLLHGYGDTRITTNVSTEGGYLFFHDLMLKLSRSTGWPGEGYSPREIDRMLWRFGRAQCNSRPHCLSCPVAAICATGLQRSDVQTSGS